MTDKNVARAQVEGAASGGRSVAAHVARVLGAAALFALATNVTVPLDPVPVTLQTLALYLAVATMDPREATEAALAYLAAGALGAHVFAGGVGGVARLVGPTGGFLIGFAVAALVATRVRVALDRRGAPALAAVVASCLVAYAITFGLGVAQLVVLGMDLPAALTAGLYPFWAIDLMKAGIAASLAMAWRSRR